MTELPAVLGAAFVTDHGLRSRTLRSLGYEHPMRGVYLRDWLDPDDALTRLAMSVELVGGGTTIGGWAAARVHEEAACPPDDDIRVFDGRRAYDEPRGPLPVLLLVPPEARVIARPGQRVFRSRVPDDERQPYLGAAVTTPLRTAFDLARLSSPAGAVIALDRLFSLGLTAPADLARMVAARPRWRGAARARRALRLAEDRVRSPMETLMRLEWRAAGLPRPLCNAVVEDADGAFVAMVDLLDERTGLVGEYDGGYHAGAERRRVDSERRELMAAVGLTPVTMTAADQASAGRRAQWRARLVHQRDVARLAERRWRIRPVLRRLPG
jgi:hypothetical protein